MLPPPPALPVIKYRKNPDTLIIGVNEQTENKEYNLTIKIPRGLKNNFNSFSASLVS
jgi:hypothetical protein